MINETITQALVEKGEEFHWTSLQVNIDSCSSPHTDKNNIGPSLIMLLGNFTGGAFNMADRSLSLDKPGQMLAIDGTQLHYSDPFYGRRVSVVAFQHNKAGQLSNVDKDRLEKLGFVSPLLAKASSASSSSQPGEPKVGPPASGSDAPRVAADRALNEVVSEASRLAGTDHGPPRVTPDKHYVVMSCPKKIKR